MRLFILSSLVLFVTACVTNSEGSQGNGVANRQESIQSNNFTTENIMKVRQGMSSEQILELFGEPSDVSVSQCVVEIYILPCTEWVYKNDILQRAIFVFANVDEGLLLTEFDVDR